MPRDSRPVYYTIIWVLVLGGCSRTHRIQPAAQVMDSPAPAVIKGFHMTESIMGRLSFELKARVAYVDPLRPVIRGTQIEMVSFNAQGREASFMTADEGILEKDSNNMKAMGNVVVKSVSGSTMETPSLEWNQAAQTIRTEDRVRLVQRDNVMTGKGLVSDPGLDHVTIGQVDAVVTDPEAFQREVGSLR